MKLLQHLANKCYGTVSPSANGTNITVYVHSFIPLRNRHYLWPITFTVYLVIFLLFLLHFLFKKADGMANVSDWTRRLRSSLCVTLMTLMMKLYRDFSVPKDNHLSCSTTTVIQKLGQRMSVISHIQQILCEPSHQQQECSLEKNSSLRSDKQQKWKPCQDSPHIKIGRQAASAQGVKHHTAWNAPKISNICVQKLWFPVTCLCFLMKRTVFLLIHNKFFCPCQYFSWKYGLC